MAETSVACLVKIKSGDQIRAHIILRPQFVIGRGTDADIPYVSSTVSRHHVRVEIQRDSITVTDLKSNNGTFIDGIALQPERPLIVQGNNIIRLGASKDEFTFQLIPVPMELMNATQQKETLLKTMAEVKVEAEILGRKALEEERKAFQAQLKLEREQVKVAFDKELDERRKAIEIQCRELLDGAKRKADEMVAKGKQTADTYHAQSLHSSLEKKKELEAKINKLQSEAQQLIEKAKAQADAEAQRIIAAAKDDAKREVNAALRNIEGLQNEAQKNKQQAEKEAQSIIAEAQVEAKRQIEQGQRNRDHAKKEAEDLLATAKADAKKVTEQAQQSRQQSEKEAERVLAAAKADAKKEVEQAHTHAEALRKEIQTKYDERIKAADKEANLILQRATSEIDKLKREAETLARAKLEDAKLHANKLLSETKSRIDAEVAEQKRLALDSVRAATLQEQENIIKEYRSSIDRLSLNKETLESQVKQLAADSDKLKSETHTLQKQAEQLKTDVLEERHMLTSIQDELETAQKTIARAEEAALEMNKAREQRDSMKAQYEKYKSDYDKGMRALADELKASKERTVLEFEVFRKQHDEELAKKKLESMERLRASIKEEEQRYQQTLGMRAVEISRAIESRLLPNLEAHLKAKGLSTSLGGVLDHIQEAVNEVVLKDKPAIQAVTEHLGIDPEKEKAKKTRIKRYALGFAAAGIAAVAAFGEQVFHYLKENRGAYTDYLIAKRSAESIYVPPQTDDWKETFTGNVLYLRNYYETKTDAIYEKEYALRLNNLELLRSMKLNEDDIIKYIGKEAALVRELKVLREDLDARFLDEGLGKMNQVEIQTIGEMREILKSDDNYETVRGIEREFTMQFLKRKARGTVRLPSQDNQ